MVSVAATDVAIVGAGAAGLATGIFLRRQNPDLRVTLFDGAKAPGAKIIVSGGGRCNVTNAVVTERDFWGGRRSVIRRVLRTLPVPDTIEFFAGIGVPLVEEAGGKLFPLSNRSRDVSGALLRELSARGARLEASRRITAVTADGGRFTLQSIGGPIRASRVVLATGGLSLPKTGSDGGGYAMAAALGHRLVATTPALVPLLLDPSQEPVHRPLSGVAVDVTLTVWIDGVVSERLSGALLWTHFGVSGPVAMNASRHWERGVLEGRSAAVSVNFLAGATFDDAERELLGVAASRPKASVDTVLSDLVPLSVASALLDACGIARDQTLAHLGREPRRRLVHALTAFPLRVTGSRGYNYAEATAGGVPLDEVHASTLESRVCPGLYLVGEILDVDGRIGGFNFQWAWASGKTAALAVSGNASGGASRERDARARRAAPRPAP